MNPQSFKMKWLTFSISGLVLVGFGLSLFGEALYLKYNTQGTWSWIGLGTLSLTVFNAGLCFFGQGVIYRVKMTLHDKFAEDQH